MAIQRVEFIRFRDGQGLELAKHAGIVVAATRRPTNGEYALNITTNSGVTVRGELSFSGTKGASK
ncbi:hypothetical protein ELH27_34425 [Rhizobium leguminosarum]|uniref:Uncharacterized protein n=1 Tax=Rhizobium beringeri TaxID=3019934 RepID=A0ABY1XHI8_9HYPH|nr:MULTISPECIES: hypothetical protein [Rhizobium]TBC54647.1 hypothetical protein ELH27_34425 [Rhizobium leguminosarum]TBC91787.1 hypothetical protein ELH21_26550 [Rhizobium leguminosarum]TBE58180.1 hypothetical protein ELH03_34580 [Rhizobium beringeri]